MRGGMRGVMRGGMRGVVRGGMRGVVHAHRFSFDDPHPHSVPARPSSLSHQHSQLRKSAVLRHGRLVRQVVSTDARKSERRVRLRLDMVITAVGARRLEELNKRFDAPAHGNSILRGGERCDKGA